MNWSTQEEKIRKLKYVCNVLLLFQLPKATHHLYNFSTWMTLKYKMNLLLGIFNRLKLSSTAYTICSKL